MGRHGAAWLAGQRLFLAEREGEILAYASFHAHSGEWALDVMRHGEIPDGTMHALIAAAIARAGAEGVPALTLAAVPEAAFPDAAPLAARAARWAGEDGAGLMRFKAAFAPRWRRLYLAAPDGPGLALAAAEIRDAVLHPPAPDGTR
jgi:phosphatidylglycerol lysyltransferase